MRLLPVIGDSQTGKEIHGGNVRPRATTVGRASFRGERVTTRSRKGYELNIGIELADPYEHIGEFAKESTQEGADTNHGRMRISRISHWLQLSSKREQPTAKGNR